VVVMAALVETPWSLSCCLLYLLEDWAMAAVRLDQINLKIRMENNFVLFLPGKNDIDLEN
jgi:hypothetical protein